MTKTLIVPGSARRDSVNKKLARVVADVASEAGLEPTLIDLADFPMPLYDGDLEAASGLPEHAFRLKALMASHPAWVFVAPEYNASMTPLLKNAIDWASRPAPGEAALATFQAKTAALFSASPGALGGMRALVQLRLCLTAVRVLVVPDDFSLNGAYQAFDEAGALRDPKHRATVRRVLDRLAAATPA